MAKKLITKKDFLRLIEKKNNVDVTITREPIRCDVIYSIEQNVIYVTFNFATLNEVTQRYSHQLDVANIDAYDRFYDTVEGLYVSDLELFNKVYVSCDCGDEIDKDDVEIEEAVKTVLVENTVETNETEYTRVTSQIELLVNNVGYAQLGIAMLIRTAYEHQLYIEGGYRNVYEYCKDKFGIARGTVSNWLMIATNFGIYDTDNDCYVLDERLKEYSITQLVLIRGLSVDEIQANIKSYMTCRQISDKVKELSGHVTKCLSMDDDIYCDVDDGNEVNDIESEDIREDNELDSLQDVTDSEAETLLYSFVLKGGATFENSTAARVLAHKLINENVNKQFRVVLYEI